MTATSVLVYDAMYAAQVLGTDQTPVSGDVQTVLRRLNRLLDLRANEKQLVYANTTETFTMTAGTPSYSTSLLTNGRPIAINNMFVTLSSIDYDVTMRDQQWWNEQAYKPINAIPENCFYDATMPSGTMNFFPRPYGAFVCSVGCQRRLTGTLVLTTDVALPPGYEAWLVAELACDIWPTFKGNKPLNKDLAEERKQARATLKRNNFAPMEMDTVFDGDLAGAVSNGFLYRGF